MSTIQTRESEMTLAVVKRLTHLRLRWLVANILTVVAATAALLGLLWLMIAATDYAFEWTQSVRQILLLGGVLVGAAGLLLLTAGVARTGRLRNLVRKLEARFPDFGQRLRTVLDIHEGRFDAPAPMQKVLGNQTLARWETSSPNQLIAYQRLWQTAAIATIVIGLLMASLSMGNQWSLAIRRSLGANLPYTVLTVEPGSIEVLEGTDVELRLKLEGRLGRKVSGKWRKTNVDSAAARTNGWIENGLEPKDKEGEERNVAQYVLALGKLSESVEYQFETSSGVTETYRIMVRPLVQVTEVKTTVVPPTYTKAATRVFMDHEVTALSGSEVSVQWLVSQPLSKLEIKIEERESAPRNVSATATENPRRWELVLPSQRTLNWQTDGVGIDGTPLETCKGRLRIREDAAPHITWKRGDESIEVHTLAEVPLQIAVSDDFAVASAQIILQFADGDERILAELGPEQLADMSRIDLQSTLPLESLGLTQRDYLGFYAVAHDNCEPNPRTAATDVRFIDIRPLRQKFREQDLMPGEANGGTFASLGELMKRQRLLINQTRRLIKLPAEALSEQIKNIDRMMQAQSELAGNTAFLAEMLIARGNDDVESLRQAEASMLQAADSLAAGTFDTALLQEQDALRWLVETRNELEQILLKNPQRSKQVKAALASLKMKLRRTRPPTALDIAIQLEQLANDQERVSKQTVAPEQTDEEAAEKRIESQSELVATANDLSNLIAKQTWPSKLIPERMDELLKSVADAERLLKQQNEEEFQPQAQSVADQARELAAHIRAANPEEPLETLAALASMAQQTAKMESELAESTAKGSSGASSVSGTNGNGTRGRLSKRIAAQAQTMEDVLANLQAPGSNKEASEASEQLESWAKQSGFSNTLAESKDLLNQEGSISKSDEPTKDTKQGSDREFDKAREEAKNRSTEYASAAEFMNDLYRQLASPKLEQLRRLETKARQLQEATEETAKKSGGTSASESNQLSAAEANAEMKELEQQLRRAGLEELAELLRQKATANSGSVNYRGLGQIAFGLHGAVQALRLEIQAIIMEQISADRNIPVPQNYAEAVDRYFQSISSPIEESDSTR